MRKLVVVAVGLFAFGTLGFSQAAKGKNSDLEQKFTSTEKQLYEAWNNHDMGVFRENFAEDVVFVGQDGIAQRKDKSIDSMTKTPCDVKSYSLGNIKVSWIDKDTALLTYKGESEATCGGKKAPSPVYASSLWVQKNGKWLFAFHQASAVPPAQ